MAAYVTQTEKFNSLIKERIQAAIDQLIERITNEAVQRLRYEINECVGVAALEIMDVCNYERFGDTLRITVDISKLPKPSKKLSPKKQP